jgi:AAA domain
MPLLNDEKPIPSALSIKDEVLRLRHRPTDMAQAILPERRWLWYGYLGAGMVTLLTSQWKSGKTTLISILLQRMGLGGQLAGLAVAPGKAAVISEEGLSDWNRRCGKLAMGDHVSFFCRPFANKPRRAQWQGLLDAMLELRHTEGLDLVVIDSLSVFLPGHDENAAAAIVESLLPLSALRDLGVSVLLVHHPKKGATLKGQAARGSGALASFVDILIEKNWHGKPDENDRRRRLNAFSRHEDTNRRLLVELSADGTDYLVHDCQMGEPADAGCWHVLNLVLEDALERLTQKQIMEEWPDDYPKPDHSTLYRALQHGVQLGLVEVAGQGRRSKPFRYWLPSVAEGFQPGLGATPQERDRFRLYWQKKVIDALGMDLSYSESDDAQDGSEPAMEMLPAEIPCHDSPPSVEAEPAQAETPAPPSAEPSEPTVPPLLKHLTIEEDIERRQELAREFRRSRRLEA